MLQVFSVRTIITSMTTNKRPRGAPKKDNPATLRVEIRVTPDEKAAWQAAAAACDKTISTWVRDLANAAALVNGEGDGPRRGS